MLALVTLAGLVVCTGFVQVRWEQHRAEAVMRRIRQMRVGEPDFHQLRDLSHESGADPKACTSERCSVYLRYENSVFRRLRLAPSTWFSAYLTAENGVLTDIQINAMTTRSNGQSGVAIFESSRFEPNLGECEDTSRQLRSHLSSAIFIKLNRSCATEMRASIYALDLSCLANLQGCTNARELIRNR
jgi:hypothetical protein